MADATRKLRLTRPSVTSRDIIAGLTNAVANIPDSMANAVLAGINPIAGLYALLLGTPVASLTTSSQLMTVVTTGSMALILGDTMAGVPTAQRIPTLVMVVLLVGIIQIALGMAKAGSLLRFVSNSVTRGFLTGVALTIVLSQVRNLTAFQSEFDNKVLRVTDTLLNPARIDVTTLAVGLVTIALILLLERTPLRKLAFAIALVAIPLATWALKLPVQTVGGIAPIESGLPSLQLPQFSAALGLLVPAFSLALVALVQSAGVCQTVPNRDGTYPRVNRDFIGQGAGNIASGLFGGMPVGGSVSSTALVTQLGATGRAANFLVGPVILVVLLFLSDAVEAIPLAVLSGMLVLVGIRAINVPAIRTVWETSLPSRAIMTLTFIGVLLIPVQYAVMLGVALSVVQYVYSASLDVRVVELVHTEGGPTFEQPVPERLPSDSVSVFDIYGSVFYAGTDAIEKLLPDPEGARRAFVVLRLRGRSDVGSTFITLLERYARRLRAEGGELYLAGVGQDLFRQLERTGLVDELGRERVFLAVSQVGLSVDEAHIAAEAELNRSAPAR